MFIDWFASFSSLALKLIPILLIAVFVAEALRLWLGEEKLRTLLSGRRPWEGKARAALLGAIVPFCECGAFPIMVGLLKAGLPINLVLTFFIISPLVSIPAFLFLTGLFGLQIAVLYLAITVSLGFVLSALLTTYGEGKGAFKGDFHVGHTMDSCGCDGEPIEEDLNNSADNTACCSTEKSHTGNREANSCCETAATDSSYDTIIRPAWVSTVATVKKILPYALAAMMIAAFLQAVAPEEFFVRIFNMTAPYNIPVAAAAGIPIYGGDCTKISLIAPFIDITNAIGPGIAFIVAGAGTSINGIVFMSSIFNKRFLAIFVMGIFMSAIFAGYVLALVG